MKANVICIENNKTLEFPKLKFTVPETLNVVDDKIILLNLVGNLPYHNLRDSFGYDIMSDVYSKHPEIKDYILKSINDLSEEYDYIIIASDAGNRLIFSDAVENKIKDIDIHTPNIHELYTCVFEKELFIYDELEKIGVRCHSDNKLFKEIYSNMCWMFNSMHSGPEDEIGTFDISKIKSGILLKSILDSFNKYRECFLDDYDAFNTYNGKKILIYDDCLTLRNYINHYKENLINVCNPNCVHIVSLFDLFTDKERYKRVVYPELKRKRRK